MFLLNNSDVMQTKDFKDKYGSLYLGLHKRNKSSLWQPFVFVLRRFTYAIIIVLLAPQSYFQIQLLVFKTSLIMAFQGQVRPFETRHQNNLELFNETLTLLSTYTLFIFTEYVPEAYARYLIGWVLIGIMIVILVANVFNML